MPDFDPQGTLETDAYGVRFALNATAPLSATARRDRRSPEVFLVPLVPGNGTA
jgi:hypothetical protein